MKLGPIQMAWGQALRDTPSQQRTRVLGTREGEVIRFCCLGKGLEVLLGSEGLNWIFQGNNYYTLSDSRIGSTSNHHISLNESYQALGLNCSVGGLTNSFTLRGRSFTSLANMNDYGLKWPEIAEFMEARPELVFERSV